VPLVAIVADTHLPRGRRRLPDACVEQLAAADLVIHAGDVVDLATLHEIEAHGPQLVAVHGNADLPEVRERLPAQEIVVVGDVRLGLIHDAGPRPGRLARMRRRFPDCDAVIFGHSHIPLHERDGDGFQIFNTGSPTDRRRQPTRTMGLARVTDGVDFELVDLGP
jgi:putative phosphoesterase